LVVWNTRRTIIFLFSDHPIYWTTIVKHTWISTMINSPLEWT
jgi:hypothetical protein